MIIRFDGIHERDRRTDRHRTTAQAYAQHRAAENARSYTAIVLTQCERVQDRQTDRRTRRSLRALRCYVMLPRIKSQNHWQYQTIYGYIRYSTLIIEQPIGLWWALSSHCNSDRTDVRDTAQALQKNSHGLIFPKNVQVRTQSSSSASYLFATKQQYKSKNRKYTWRAASETKGVFIATQLN